MPKTLRKIEIPLHPCGFGRYTYLSPMVDTLALVIVSVLISD